MVWTRRQGSFGSVCTASTLNTHNSTSKKKSKDLLINAKTNLKKKSSRSITGAVSTNLNKVSCQEQRDSAPKEREGDSDSRKVENDQSSKDLKVKTTSKDITAARNVNDNADNASVTHTSNVNVTKTGDSDETKQSKLDRQDLNTNPGSYVCLGELTKVPMVPMTRGTSVPAKHILQLAELHVSPSTISDVSEGNFKRMSRHQSVPAREIDNRSKARLPNEDAGGSIEIVWSPSQSSKGFDSAVVFDKGIRPSKSRSNSRESKRNDRNRVKMKRNSSNRSVDSKSIISNLAESRETKDDKIGNDYDLPAFVRTSSSKSNKSSRSGVAILRNSSYKSGTGDSRSYLRTNSSKSGAGSRKEETDTPSKSYLNTPNALVGSFSSPARLNRSSGSKGFKLGKKKNDLKKNLVGPISSPVRPVRNRSKDPKMQKGHLSPKAKKKPDFGRSKSFDSPFGKSSRNTKPNDVKKRSTSKSPARGQSASRSVSGKSQSPFGIRSAPGTPTQVHRKSLAMATSSSKRSGKGGNTPRGIVTQSKNPVSPPKNLVAKKPKKNQKTFTPRNRVRARSLTSPSIGITSEQKQMLYTNKSVQKVKIKKIGEREIAVPTPILPTKFTQSNATGIGMTKTRKTNQKRNLFGFKKSEKNEIPSLPKQTAKTVRAKPNVSTKGVNASDLSGFYTDDEIAVINDTGSLVKLKVVTEEEETLEISSDEDDVEDSKDELEHYKYYKEKAKKLSITKKESDGPTTTEDTGLRWCKKGDVYLRQGNDKLAIKAYHTSLKVTKNSLEYGVSPLLASEHEKKVAKKLVTGLLVKAHKDVQTRLKRESSSDEEDGKSQDLVLKATKSEDLLDVKPMLFDNTGVLRRRMESCTRALEDYTESVEKYKGKKNTSDRVRRKRKYLEEKMYMYQQELQKIHARTGVMLPRVADLLMEIGSAHEKRGNASSAVAFYQEGIRVRKASLADDHRKLTLKKLGIISDNEKDNGKAVEALITSLHRCRDVSERGRNKKYGKYPFLENSDLLRELAASPTNSVGCRGNIDKYDWNALSLDWTSFPKFPTTVAEFRAIFVLEETDISSLSNMINREVNESPEMNRHNMNKLLQEAIQGIGVGLEAFGEAFDLNDSTVDNLVKEIVKATPKFIRRPAASEYLSFSSDSFYSDSESSFDDRRRWSRSRSDGTSPRNRRRRSRKNRRYPRGLSSGVYSYESDDDNMSMYSAVSAGSRLLISEVGSKTKEIFDKTLGVSDFDIDSVGYELGNAARSMSFVLARTRSEPELKLRNFGSGSGDESSKTQKLENFSKRDKRKKKSHKRRIKRGRETAALATEVQKTESGVSGITDASGLVDSRPGFEIGSF
mmetsp:Transcript_5954/g.12464  ORF Transcript_5954/g.12464 Transcript_5954/m.12464 type:complete len:1346 (-) Transcript_5954:120-4157(-)